ncbi:MAG: zinc ribbon domain-containing protein [Atopobiaceae bacterium]|nr:zinc ribbon domain-containing protein [Atopobiaceae bacterium]
MMQCTYCGKELEDGTITCERCGADLSTDALTRRIVHTILYAAIMLVCISLLIYLVLYWHETQVLSMHPFG